MKNYYSEKTDRWVTVPENDAEDKLTWAAPDLLEACKGLLAFVVNYPHIHNLAHEPFDVVTARAAIAKSEGKEESHA